MNLGVSECEYLCEYVNILCACERDITFEVV